MTGTGELRQNPVTGRWVVVAPRRAERPVEGEGDAAREAGAAGATDPSCPFCPGNEDRLATVLHETPGRGDLPWGTRAVPNRFPAFANDPRHGEWVDRRVARRPGALLGQLLPLESRLPATPGTALPAVGYQEVLVETPLHGRDLPDMSGEEMEAVLELYQGRYRVVAESVPECQVILFRNRGPAAGASLAHAHAQLVVTAAVPPGVRIRDTRMLDFHAREGRCLLCALPELEQGWEDRVVARTEFGTAVVPWAAEAPLEVWILPRVHRPDFGAATAPERADLARLLGRVTRAVRECGGDPDYNVLLHTPRGGQAGQGALHWFMVVRPRGSQLAGFELATGVLICPSSPLEDAALLRDALSRSPASGAPSHSRTPS